MSRIVPVPPKAIASTASAHDGAHQLGSNRPRVVDRLQDQCHTARRRPSTPPPRAPASADAFGAPLPRPWSSASCHPSRRPPSAGPEPMTPAPTSMTASARHIASVAAYAVPSTATRVVDHVPDNEEGACRNIPQAEPVLGGEHAAVGASVHEGSQVQRAASAPCHATMRFHASSSGSHASSSQRFAAVGRTRRRRRTAKLRRIDTSRCRHVVRSPLSPRDPSRHPIHVPIVPTPAHHTVRHMPQVKVKGEVSAETKGGAGTDGSVRVTANRGATSAHSYSP